MVQFNKKQITKIETFLNSLSVDNVDIPYLVDIDSIDPDNACDSIYDMISEGGGFDVEIIYYSNAIEYLMTHDPSLKESLELANDLGFTPDNLSSEILASLLASEYAREEFAELQDEINDFFADLID